MPSDSYGSYTLKVDPPTFDKPVDVPALLREAMQLHRGGRLGEAEGRYRKILATQPKHAQALHYLGLIALRARRYDTAAQLIEESIAVAPDNAESHSNLGIALAMMRRSDEAQAAYARALALDPRHADAAFNLGNLLRERERYAAAEASYAQAIASNPGHTGALANLANLYALQQRSADAARAFGVLGNVLQELGRTDDALNAYQQSLTLAPDPGIEVQRAFVVPVVAASVAEIDQVRDRLIGAMSSLRASGLRLADPLRYASSAPTYTAHHGRNDRALKRAFADFYLGATPELAWSAPHCAGYAGPGDRIRVGVVSRFLRDEHAIGKSYGAVVDQLDRRRFDVTEFRVATANDSSASGRAQTLVPGDDLASARSTIAAARLDVLLYPEVGIDPATYFLAMGRLAPVQCASLGHPVTTGIASVDYFLSTGSTERPEASDHYTETLVRLAGSANDLLRPPSGGAAVTRGEFGLPADRRLYVCAQNPARIHPDFDPVLAEILRRDPQALLVLFHGARTESWGERLMQRLRRSMPDGAARVVLLPFLKVDVFLGLLQTADAVLDTPHFDCGTTSLEALGLGIPVVTWPGIYAKSRRTQAFYRRMQIDGPIASDAAHYVELALRLAQDRAWRDALRLEIRERASALHEGRAVVGELEAFFAAAVAAAGAGRKIDAWPQ